MIVSEDRKTYVCNREAQRLSGKSSAGLYRAALLGYIGYQLVPGEPVKFDRDDVMRLAAMNSK
jgi:hypothetical protein